MKHNTTFADFPIPLGAEWLHVDTSIFSEIVNDSSVNITTSTQGYQKDDVVGYYDGTYTTYTLSRLFGNFEDKKFINSSWLDFFETYIVPHIQSHFTFNSQITRINYEGGQVMVTDNNNQIYQASKVIVTVPLKILQENTITFTPPLPSSKQDIIQDAPVWGGIKVFLEFKENFYPTYLTFPDSETKTGQRLYYDAAYAQSSSKNILGLFAVGRQATPYQNLSGTAQLDYILNELDLIFNGKASQNYVKHIVQNWNDEPYIKAAYLADNAPLKTSRTLSSSVQNKLYFAGDAYTQENDWGAVHNAIQSAIDAVTEMV
ncbi:amine oxidase [Flammeovirga sp. SJP92]|nr:amine oxidase [Flammeovirga sp. SJP92]